MTWSRAQESLTTTDFDGSVKVTDLQAADGGGGDYYYYRG
jgi:hypothetical protein